MNKQPMTPIQESGHNYDQFKTLNYKIRINHTSIPHMQYLQLDKIELEQLRIELTKAKQARENAINLFAS